MHTDFAPLLNTGIVVGNIKNGAQAQDSKHGSAVILGVARSGTSMISGALHHMGLFMGDGASAPIYEDTVLAQALENKEKREVQRLVNFYSSRHTLWGFKRPLSLLYLSEIEELFPAPKYIAVFKDILSIANRNQISMHIDVLSGLDQALSEYSRLINFLRRTSCPYMLVSYDKALFNPGRFIDALETFLHLDITEEQRTHAIEFISPNPIDYIDTSRITKAVGRLGMVKRKLVAGWAKYVHCAKPATVVLFINSKEVNRVTANLYRQDLKENGVHPSGHCAFHFDLTNMPLNSSDEIRVRVTDEVKDLDNSPLIYRGEEECVGQLFK